MLALRTSLGVGLFVAFCSILIPAVQVSGASYRVVSKSVVYDGGQSGQPGIVRTRDGSLLVTFYSGPNIFTTVSRDNGRTWEKPKEIIEGASTEVSVTRLNDGTVLWPFFQEFIKNPCCEVRRYNTFVYRSQDNGATWQGDAPITTDMREPIPYGHIVELPDGKLLMPVWGAYRLGERWQVGTFESTDRGKTWGSYRQIAYDPKAGCRPDNGFNETSLALLPDHTLIAILREQRVGTRDHTAEAGPCDEYTEPTDVYFYRAVSHDLGKTWSQPERLALIGTSPSLHVLPDGTLMLGYRDSPQHKTDTQHYGLAIRISKDQGATWTDELHLEDPQGLRYSKKFQPGYPDFADLPNGDILVVFHSVDVKNGKPHLYIAENIIRQIR